MRVSLWIHEDNENWYYQLPKGEAGPLMNQLIREHRAKLKDEVPDDSDSSTSPLKKQTIQDAQPNG